MDISGPVAILLFFLLLLVDMFFYGFDAAIDNLNEKEILHKAEEEKDRRSVRSCSRSTTESLSIS